MDENPPSRKTATETAEKILAAIYGDDLLGCPVNLETISAIVQEGISAETKSFKMLNEALIGALRQIQSVSTPPSKEEIESVDEVVNLLSERADAINHVTTKILEAWEKAKPQI
ncbi:MAG: hypothetical protein ABIR24_11870 [Verrucomicrobiota bacterium]